VQIIPNEYIDYNFNFGIYISLYNDIPVDFILPDLSYYVVIGKENKPIQNIELKPGWWFKSPFNYFYPWILSLWGMENDKLVKLHEHKIDLENKNVFFKLVAKTKNENDIWLNYLEIFENRMNCKIHIQSNFSTGNFKKYIDDINFYASYNVGWEDNLNQNPLGTNFNSFELINNQLLRI